ncbi:DoxX family protein [Rubrolithibacter danxiaensis]|uniref:DoxX family protein n=1 Tax=Rubrolithibacter danxiaensis TaxID=3390805 RepID=UPI003BF77F6F
MRNFFFSASPFYNLPGLFILRLIAGATMLTHGYPKLQNLLAGNFEFADPFGVGVKISLYFAVFAEVMCSILICLGLMTRLAVIPLIIMMAVACFIINKAEPFAAKELSFLYMGMYLTLFFTGPGKFSLDRFFMK